MEEEDAKQDEVEEVEEEGKNSKDTSFFRMKMTACYFILHNLLLFVYCLSPSFLESLQGLNMILRTFAMHVQYLEV